jgi:hypothetical protein
MTIRTVTIDVVEKNLRLFLSGPRFTPMRNLAAPIDERISWRHYTLYRAAVRF